MAETVNVAGKQYPRTAVYAAAAAVLGIAGYAWFTRGGRQSAGEADFLVPEVPEEPTGMLPFSGTQSGTFTEGPVAFRNDQEWYAAAVNTLTLNYGVGDTPTAAAALDRYLASTPLTATQIPMIHYVINTIGPPPSGARTIRQESAPGGGVKPPAGAPPGAVRNLSVSTSRTQMRAVWFVPLTGEAVRSYKVRFYGGRAGGGTFTVREFTTTARDVKSPGNLQPAHSYGVEITPVGVSGQSGPTSRAVTQTKK